jgi:hypothetical protein
VKKSKRYTIKIGYRDYTLRFVKKVDKEDSHGDTDYKKGVLRINRSLKGVELCNTILHEVNHAVLDDKGIALEFSLDEQVVQGMTNGQIAFIIDNPEFFRLLLELMGV